MLAIQELRSAVYKLLSSNSGLRGLNVVPYLSIHQNLKGIFILIGVSHTNLRHKKDKIFYHLELELAIYSRFGSEDALFHVTKIVGDLLQDKSSLGLLTHRIIGICQNKTDFEQSNEMQSAKVIMRYKCLLEGRVNE